MPDEPLAATLSVDLPIRVWLSVQTACQMALNDVKDDPTLERDVGYAHARIDVVIKESPAWVLYMANWRACDEIGTEETQ